MFRLKELLPCPSPGLAATLSRPTGEGLGVRAFFHWKFMDPMLVLMICTRKLPISRASPGLGHPLPSDGRGAGG